MKRSAFVKVAAALGVVAGLQAPASAQVALTGLGIQAPTAGINVGTNDLKKGTIQYTNSTGSSDNFSVGTNTTISANASASSTADYHVTSKANFALGATSTINQLIGTASAAGSSSSMSIEQSAAASAESTVSQNFKTSHNGQSGWWWWGDNQWNSTTETDYNSKIQAAYESAYESAYDSFASQQSGTVSGTFTKNSGELTTNTVQTNQIVTDSAGSQVKDGNGNYVIDVTNTTSIKQVTPESNDVVVKGIGANNTVSAASTASFTSDIIKAAAPVPITQVVDSTNNTTTTTFAGSGTANGSAAGGVNTAASASSNSSQFVNSFVQAF